MIPSPVLFDNPGYKALSRTAKHLHLVLMVRANQEGKAWPSIPRLMVDTAISKEALIAGVDELEKAGFETIERRKGPRQANIYSIESGSTESGTIESGSAENTGLIVLNPVHKQLKNRYKRNPSQPPLQERKSKWV